VTFVESAPPVQQQHHDQDRDQQSPLPPICHLQVEGTLDQQPWDSELVEKEVLQGIASLYLQDHNFQEKPMLAKGITLHKILRKLTEIGKINLAEINVNLVMNNPLQHQLNKIEILFLEEETGIFLENLD